MQKLIVTLVLLLAVAVSPVYATSAILPDNVDTQRERALAFFHNADYNHALPWITKAVESNDATAMYLLSLLYGQGLAVEQDFAQSWAWLLKSAELGYAPAQYAVGQAYWQDWGDGKVPITFDAAFLQQIKNTDTGWKWLQKAAQNGYAPAQRDLGRTYFNDSQYEASLYWFRLAAGQNDAIAQYRVGFMYETGRAVERDRNAAAQWYAKSAEGGYLLAQHVWAQMLYEGKTVKADYTEAFKWQLASARQGYEPAEYCTAIMYIHGEGVDENYAEAVKWLEAAAAHTDKYPYFYLLSSYAYNLGDMNQDYVKLFVWLQMLMHDPAFRDTVSDFNFRYVVNDIQEKIIHMNDWDRAAAILKERGITVDKDKDYLE